MTTERTEIEEFFEQLRNSIEFRLTLSKFVCSISQKGGQPSSHLALDFNAEVCTDSVKQSFATALLRVAPFAGTYGKRPNGEIVLGTINPTDKNLEIALAIPESAFLALVSEKSSLVGNIWPFESVETWNKRDALHIREAQFQSK